MLGMAVMATLMVGSVQQATAVCYCDEQAIGDEYNERDAVFVGRVVEQRRINIPNTTNPKLPPVTPHVDSVMEVTRTFKGALASYVVLRTKPNSPVYCGYEFDRNAEYLVWASNASGALGYYVTWNCTRTRKKAEAADDLRWLYDSYGP